MSRKNKVLVALGATSVFAAAVFGAVGAGAADHLDAPGVRADGRTDINDVYTFKSPTDPNNTVLIMTVNPVAGVVSGTTFHPNAKYRFNVDNNGDAIADTVIEAKFDKVRNDGSQGVAVKVNGSGRGTKGKGTVGSPVALERGNGRFIAGVFDDPFFFDLDGFRNNFQFTGANFFSGLNVSAIVVEVPSSLLGTDGIGVWATTSIDDAVIDQMGRPAINTALIASSRKDLFNRTPPSQQRSVFGAEVTAAITALSGDADYAAAIANVLIPDILTFEIGNSAGFLNGRAPADDVIDAELSVLTKGGLTTDGVANDSAFPGVFPYLSPAN
jgi:Domain of unknown function (DUF4331)